MKYLILILCLSVNVFSFTEDEINQAITIFERKSGFKRSDRLYRVMKNRIDFRSVGRDVNPCPPFEVVKSLDDEGVRLEDLIKCFMETQVVNMSTAWEDIVHLIPIKR